MERTNDRHCHACGAVINADATNSNPHASSALVEEVSRVDTTSGQGYIKQTYKQHRRHRSPLQPCGDSQITRDTYSEQSSYASQVPSLTSSETTPSSRSIATPMFNQNGGNKCSPAISTTPSPSTTAVVEKSLGNVQDQWPLRIGVAPGGCSPPTVFTSRLPQVSTRGGDDLSASICPPSWLKTSVEAANVHKEHLRPSRPDQMGEVETKERVLYTVAASPNANTWSDLARTRHIYAQKELPPIPKSPKQPIQRPRTAGVYRPFPKVEVGRKSCDVKQCEEQPSQSQVFHAIEARHASVDQIAHKRFQRWVRRVLW